VIKIKQEINCISLGISKRLEKMDVPWEESNIKAILFRALDSLRCPIHRWLLS